MTSITPQTRQRIMRSDLTALDGDLASPGMTLYTPMFGDGQVYLLDVDGVEVHRWDPYPPGL